MRKERNSLGGDSIVLDDPADLSKLGGTYQSLITKAHRAVFAAHPNSTRALAETFPAVPEVPHLKLWLRSLADHPCTLEVHTTSPRLDIQEVWLRFEVREAWRPAINLKRFDKASVKYVPGVLASVYRWIGEVNHNAFFVGGGLYFPEATGDDFLFYRTQTGDRALYTEANQVLWSFYGGCETDEDEEEDATREYGHVTQFLDDYFAALWTHKELRMEPR